MTEIADSAARLHIDWTRCDGRGLCSELLPGLLTRDDWGYPLARDGSREPPVPGQAMADARRAVVRCPRLALSLVARTTHTKAANTTKNETH